MMKLIKRLFRKSTELGHIETDLEKYEIIHIETYTKLWSDSGPCYMSIIFKQAPNGKRKVETQGSIYPAKIENEKWWHDIVVPWLNGFINPSNESSEIKKDNVVKLELVKK